MICDTIKELRERTGLSQSALAKKVGGERMGNGAVNTDNAVCGRACAAFSCIC